jgi:hypothetical protein
LCAPRHTNAPSSAQAFLATRNCSANLYKIDHMGEEFANASGSAEQKHEKRPTWDRWFAQLRFICGNSRASLADDFTLASGSRFTMNHWLIVVLNVTFDRIFDPPRPNPPRTALVFRFSQRFKKFGSQFLFSFVHTGMTSPKEVQADLSNAVARWENEGGSPGRVESDKNTSWFVPPLVVPALLSP